MSHHLSELLLALLARVWRDEPQSVRAVVGPAGKGVDCGEMSHNLSELLLALPARVWRYEPQSVSAVVALPARVWRYEPQSVRVFVGPAAKGVER
jgi:hypothetical protein